MLQSSKNKEIFFMNESRLGYLVNSKFKNLFQYTKIIENILSNNLIVGENKKNQKLKSLIHRF
jgi:hypothetical protein